MPFEMILPHICTHRACIYLTPLQACTRLLCVRILSCYTMCPYTVMLQQPCTQGIEGKVCMCYACVCNNSYNLNIYRYLTSSLCAYLYQRWHKRNCPTDLEVAGQVSKFITAFSLYGKCHNIWDQNFNDAAQAHALDQVGKQRSVYM